MIARHTHRDVARRIALSAALGLSVLGAGCQSGSSTEVRAASTPEASLVGTVSIDGSSTVLPISKAMADAFRHAHPAVQLNVNESGTGGGFEKLCAGSIDIAAASRPINAAEMQACKDHKVDYLELPMAFDSLSVVVNANNTFVDCLTVPELKTIWEPAAEGKIKSWKQVRSSFPEQPLTLFGPDEASGTFDYFTLAIVGTEHTSRKDYTKNADDVVLVNGVAGDANALGYFGYGYYQANRDKLKAVPIDSGRGCIAPSAKTVADYSYQPLTRPLFLYVSTASASRPETRAFAKFYVDPDNSAIVRDTGYVPLPTVALLFAGRRLDKNITGTVLGGHGSVLGVTAEIFENEDKIKSALVQ
jgi:phosphate transport system substrate-binding protein